MTPTRPIFINGAHWQTLAHCGSVQPDVMQPDPADLAAIAEAKSVCAQCPIAVRSACLAEAIEGGMHYGVAGGKTPDERRRYAAARTRQRQREAASRRAQAESREQVPA